MFREEQKKTNVELKKRIESYLKMSNWHDSKGPVPPRWLDCPRKSSKLINNKFLAFKTPLSSAFDSQVPEACRFNLHMLFESLRSHKIKLGLWIDLTNTNRFYDKEELREYECNYVKLSCRGHGETPSESQTSTFISICKKFISRNPLEQIGVHCTHGFNRTGFLIASYLVEVDGFSIDAALAAFMAVRPPGIYKGDYIKKLYATYDDVEDAPEPPNRPAWCLEDDGLNVEDTDEGTSTGESGPPRKKKKYEHINKNPIFMSGVPGVSPITEERKVQSIRRCVQEMCAWESTGFPGSQPVSMDLTNIELLHKKPYRVSWKADGTRYMMFIQSEREVFFLDRDNNVFEVKGLTFPSIRQPNCFLRDTLLDGEMVMEKINGKEYPRYLAYDVISFNGEKVMQKPFFPDRYQIERQIMEARYRAFREGRVRREDEPFSVKLKEFWDVTQAVNLLSEKFAKQLTHEPDGLIFQPSKEPYVAGSSDQVLKWKPSSLNSVDFKLKIETESGMGIIPRKIGALYVGGLNKPFGTMKITKQIKNLNNTIIECKLENGQWIYMRERTDKSFPNSLNTANAVCKSIVKPVTREILLDYIERHRFAQDDSELMPPPNRR